MQKKKYLIPNTKYLILALLKKRDGQSLIEILIALAIGALMIGAASIGVAFMLRSTSTNQNLQTASGFMQELVNKTHSFSESSWQNIYGLTKGTSTQYYLAPSSTLLFAVQGKEGELDNDVVSGMVGKWGLDEATGTYAYDGTGNNYTGTLYNAPTHATSTCEVGNCLSFDGSTQYVDMPGFSGMTAFARGTLAFWVYPTRWSNYDNMAGFQSAATNVNAIRIENSSGKVRAIFGNASGSYTDVLSKDTLTTDAWHHVALTWDSASSTATLYLDGSVGTSTITTWPSSYATFRIGNAYLGRYFQGRMDDVRVYNRELSADEVHQINNSNPFSRYFSVEDVCRTNDASSTITGVAPCGSGSFQDPSTEKVTTVVEWPTRGSTASTQVFDYVTRWKNDVFEQTDWSGGSGSSGAYTEPGSVFSSSSNVDTGTQGTIRIHNL